MSRRMRRLPVTANVVPSSPSLVTLMMEALRSSETSVLTRARRRHYSLFLVLEFRTMDKVQNPSNSECYILSSESFRFYCFRVPQLYRQSRGFLRCGISPWQGPTQTQNKRKHPFVKWDSNRQPTTDNRSACWQRAFCGRPFVKWDSNRQSTTAVLVTACPLWPTIREMGLEPTTAVVVTACPLWPIIREMGPEPTTAVLVTARPLWPIIREMGLEPTTAVLVTARPLWPTIREMGLEPTTAVLVTACPLWPTISSHCQSKSYIHTACSGHAAVLGITKIQLRNRH
jgi:hypothetical protein